jgi:2-aminoethylphosphonate dioxygenase
MTLGTTETASLQEWVATIEQWPPGSHVWGHYAEQTDGGPKICRTENVSECHPGIASLVVGPLLELAEAYFDAPAVAFKDKVNYKQPGGAGFSPHQDVLAYPGVRRVVSVLVAVDACNASSGCLWVADGVDEVLPTDDRGVVAADVARDLRWSAREMAPGDAIVFGGLVPHFSEANRSGAPRRVLVVSYAPAAEGYSRDAYYGARRRAMAEASARDGRFRISTLADFEGTEVAPSGPPAGACSHDPVP